MGYVGGSLVSFFDEDAQAATALACRRMADRAGDRMVDLTIANTPIDKGVLRSSWYQKPVQKTFVAVWPAYESGVATDVDYAPYVEWDTRPHEIRAKAGGVLRWIDSKTGDVRYATIVHHPGTTGQHMVGIAADVVESEADSGFLFTSILNDWKRDVEAGVD